MFTQKEKQKNVVIPRSPCLTCLINRALMEPKRLWIECFTYAIDLLLLNCPEENRWLSKNLNCFSFEVRVNKSPKPNWQHESAFPRQCQMTSEIRQRRLSTPLPPPQRLWPQCKLKIAVSFGRKVLWRCLTPHWKGNYKM